MSNWAPFLLLFLVLVTGVQGVDYVAEGEKFLSVDNPTKALTYFEAALAQGESSERLLLNLGLAYQRTAQGTEARKVFRQGADLGGPLRRTFLLNLGVSAFLAKDFAAAEATYTEALTQDPGFSEALLNRANTRLSLKDWAGAASDYRSYQAALPANPQKEKIDQVIALLEKTATEAEVQRLADETKKKREAEAKAAQEAQNAAERAAQEEAAAAAKAAQEAEAEAERQRQEEILARIRDSLVGAGEDSRSLSTGPASVKTEDDDFALEP